MVGTPPGQRAGKGMPLDQSLSRIKRAIPLVQLANDAFAKDSLWPEQCRRVRETLSTLLQDIRCLDEVCTTDPYIGTLADTAFISALSALAQSLDDMLIDVELLQKACQTTSRAVIQQKHGLRRATAALLLRCEQLVQDLEEMCDRQRQYAGAAGLSIYETLLAGVIEVLTTLTHGEFALRAFQSHLLRSQGTFRTLGDVSPSDCKEVENELYEVQTCLQGVKRALDVAMDPGREGHPRLLAPRIRELAGEVAGLAPLAKILLANVVVYKSTCLNSTRAVVKGQQEIQTQLELLLDGLASLRDKIEQTITYACQLFPGLDQHLAVAAGSAAPGSAPAGKQQVAGSIALPPYCDACGAPMSRAGALFCASCGHPFAAGKGSTMAGYGTSRRIATGYLPAQRILRRRYLILSLLGRGGFGAVYKVADTQLGNRVLAIKEMGLDGLDQAEAAVAIDAFKREALLLAGLMHPNLPRVYDQFVEAGRSYLIMDCIEGETLEAYMKQTKALLIEEALDIGLQLCDVLGYLHSQQPPVIFRDLKPANVMRSPEGHLYLIDFGIARHFKPGQLKDTVAFGSVGYAAPEQYGRAQTTARADLYSLGAVLHQCLSGDDPAASPFTFAPLPPESEATRVGLDALLACMVSVDVAKRPPSVADVQQVLQRIAHLLQQG